MEGRNIGSATLSDHDIELSSVLPRIASVRAFRPSVPRIELTLSPRWLVAHGHIDRARAVLQKTRDPDAYEEELAGIIEAINYEKIHMSGVSYKQFIFDPSTRWRFFLAVVINFGQQATGRFYRSCIVRILHFHGTGQGSLNSYSTIIYSKVFKSNSTVQLINAINASLGILFTLNASCKYALWYVRD